MTHAIHRHRVYPRVHGGTPATQAPASSASGLSPRARGNRRGRTPSPSPTRSIPACTGEPGSPLSGSGLPWVYPRVHGGTMGEHFQALHDMGLSPRARGNRDNRIIWGATDGSIPACTGEPRDPRRVAGESQVYPRVHGGTPYAALLDAPDTGLSPRARGNRYRRRAARPGRGSIPACTGEPGVGVP